MLQHNGSCGQNGSHDGARLWVDEGGQMTGQRRGQVVPGTPCVQREGVYPRALQRASCGLSAIPSDQRDRTKYKGGVRWDHQLNI